MEEQTPDPEQLEQERRKRLEEFQQKEADNSWLPLWARTFDLRDKKDLSTYVPTKPYESLQNLIERTRRGAAVVARSAVCDWCRDSLPVSFCGFLGNGSEVWSHAIEKCAEPPVLSWIDTFLSNFGYQKHQPLLKQMTHPPCPASGIIQRFRLEQVPEEAAANPGAYYCPYPSTYRDPGETPIP